MKKKTKKVAQKKTPAGTKVVKKDPIVPIYDRLLVKPLSAEEGGKMTASGIIIPDTAEKDRETKRGVVTAAGGGRFDDGVRIPMQVKVGDTVLFQWGDKVKIDGVEYYIVSESNVLAVING